MNFQGVHAKVLILQYILGVAHFSASNIVFPPGGRLRPKRVHHLQETDCPLKTTKNREKKGGKRTFIQVHVSISKEKVSNK